MAQLVYRTGWMVRGSNPGRAKIFFPLPEGPYRLQGPTPPSIQKVEDTGPVTGLEWPRGFQEFKVPIFHDNGTGWW